ncbi:hypothetical protein [Staphylococcus simulans]|uniref:hypothetical protein n=1 Tax=Staphylococcus simulans TaxID=1286 RepID=UPI0021CEBAC1|nr:hypothetical protein [Staphylococcus simulans]UXR49595.1 hypothetical protein MUA28_10630 [Staphylococcus simulans]
MGKNIKNKVKNTHAAKNNVANNKTLKEEFKVVLPDENWLRACSLNKDKFTNKYNDFESMAKTLTKIMTVLIPDIQKNGYDIFNQNSIYHQRKTHCHTITKDKYDKIKNIMNQIYSYETDIFSDEEKKLWQYGAPSGLRVKCIYDKANNYVYPLFVDPFHLIYPDIKHNQDDFMTNKLCPIKSFNENSS